jgi:hypothetical protein
MYMTALGMTFGFHVIEITLSCRLFKTHCVCADPQRTSLDGRTSAESTHSASHDFTSPHFTKAAPLLISLRRQPSQLPRKN